MPRESFGTVVKRRSLGLLLLVLVAALVTLSILIYNKAFTSTVDVTLVADHTGNELLVDSDVAERGVIVGSVKAVRANGKQAIVTLALEPGRTKNIPANVKALILPKTLFGEQYVDLVIPQQGDGTSAHPIEAGDTIPQDRSKGALEAQTVISQLYPVLTAVEPAELNSTLTAIATALNGRGKELGQTLTDFQQYLTKMNPHTAQLADDLGKLGQVAKEYNGALPDIFATLRNLETNVRTIVARKQALANLFTAGSGTADTLSSFLSQNRSSLIDVAAQGKTIFGLLAEYSPEFPCLAAGVNYLANRINSSVAYNHRLNLAVIVDSDASRTQAQQKADLNAYGPYIDGEQPTLVTGYGPNCFGLPDDPQPTDSNGNFQIPAKYRCLNDGAPLTNDACSTDKSRTSTTTSGTKTAKQTAMVTGAGSPEETALVNAVLATQLGTTPNRIPAADTLLAAPLMRGHQVVVR